MLENVGFFFFKNPYSVIHIRRIYPIGQDFRKQNSNFINSRLNNHRIFFYCWQILTNRICILFVTTKTLFDVLNFESMYHTLCIAKVYCVPKSQSQINITKTVKCLSVWGCVWARSYDFYFYENPEKKIVQLYPENS